MRVQRIQATQCQKFEQFHFDIMNRLKPLVADGGNLVVTKDFFRNGSKYYKVTEKVDTLPFASRKFLRFLLMQSCSCYGQLRTV